MPMSAVNGLLNFFLKTMGKNGAYQPLKIVNNFFQNPCKHWA
jgi:hypothetical protein